MLGIMLLVISATVAVATSRLIRHAIAAANIRVTIEIVVIVDGDVVVPAAE
jgi:hypothetical protein